MGLNRVLPGLPRPEDIRKKLHYFRRTRESGISDYAWGLFYLIRRDTGRALQNFERAVTTYGDSPVVHFLIAYGSGLERAARAWEKVAALRPGDFDALICWTAADLLLGNLERAEKHLRKARRIFPGSFHLLMRLGHLRQLQGKYRPALRYFIRCLEADPDYLEAAWRAAYCYRRLGKYKEAVARVEESLFARRKHRVIVPTSEMISLFEELSMSQMLLNNYGEAIRALEFLARFHSNEWVYWHLGNCYLLRDGPVEKARETFRRGLQASPLFAQALCKMALAYSERERPELALAALSDLRSRAATKVRAVVMGRQGLRVLAGERPDFEKAKELFAACLRLDVMRRGGTMRKFLEGMLAYSSGWLEFERGRHVAALRHYSMAEKVFRWFGYDEIVVSLDLLQRLVRIDDSLRRLGRYRMLSGVFNKVKALEVELDGVSDDLSRSGLCTFPSEGAVVGIKSQVVKAMVRALRGEEDAYEGLDSARTECLRRGLMGQADAVDKVEVFVKECSVVLPSYRGDLGRVPRDVQLRLIELLSSVSSRVAGDLPLEMMSESLRQFRERVESLAKEASLRHLKLKRFLGAIKEEIVEIARSCFPSGREVSGRESARARDEATELADVEEYRDKLYIEGREEGRELTIVLYGKTIPLQFQSFMLLFKFAVSRKCLSDEEQVKFEDYNIAEPRRARSNLNIAVRPWLGRNLIKRVGPGSYGLDVPPQEIAFNKKSLLNHKFALVAKLAHLIPE